MRPPDATGARDLQFEPPSRFSISTSPSGDKNRVPLAAALLGMAGCVLLIASLNLVNMLPARRATRVSPLTALREE